MTDSLLLEIAIVKANLRKKDIAGALGLTPMGLSKKINNVTEFKASEISALSALLRIGKEERDAIFFKVDVELKSTN